MRLDQASHNRNPAPAAATLGGAAGVAAAEEPLENPLAHLRRDAWTMVANAHGHQARVFVRHLDCYRRAGRAVAVRVGEQVVEYLPEPVPVRKHLGPRSAGIRFDNSFRRIPMEPIRSRGDRVADIEGL